MSLDSKRFTFLFAVGAAILILGLVLQWYPISVVGGLEEKLKETGLSTDERNKFQGALDSWEVLQITTFQPLSSVLFAVGIIIIVYSVISGVFSIASSYKVVKKSE
jgi:hypothetical protein